jgi:hypothetical protein
LEFPEYFFQYWSWRATISLSISTVIKTVSFPFFSSITKTPQGSWSATKIGLVLQVEDQKRWSSKISEPWNLGQERIYGKEFTKKDKQDKEQKEAV